MIVAGLLLIIAILLFGSSAVIGAFGAILGFIAFASALAVAGYHAGPLIEKLGLNGDNAVALIILTICGILAVGRLIIYLIDRRG